MKLHRLSFRSNHPVAATNMGKRVQPFDLIQIATTALLGPARMYHTTTICRPQKEGPSSPQMMTETPRALVDLYRRSHRRTMNQNPIIQ